MSSKDLLGRRWQRAEQLNTAITHDPTTAATVHHAVDRADSRPRSEVEHGTGGADESKLAPHLAPREG